MATIFSCSLSLLRSEHVQCHMPCCFAGSQLLRPMSVALSIVETVKPPARSASHDIAEPQAFPGFTRDWRYSTLLTRIVTGAVRSGGDAERRQMAKCGGAVDASVDDTTAFECGGLCVGQQAGTDRMGSAGEGGRVLSDPPILPEDK